jgi:hypothetical protein
MQVENAGSCVRSRVIPHGSLSLVATFACRKGQRMQGKLLVVADKLALADPRRRRYVPLRRLPFPLALLEASLRRRNGGSSSPISSPRSKRKPPYGGCAREAKSWGRPPSAGSIPSTGRRSRRNHPRPDSTRRARRYARSSPECLLPTLRPEVWSQASRRDGSQE